MTGRAIIVVSSLVARGTVGARAAMLALEALGHPVWAVPTVTLPWHPGHAHRRGETARIVADDAAFRHLCEDLAGAPWLGEVGGILTGYMATPAQAEATAGLVRAVRERVTDAKVVCDPVIGDFRRDHLAEAGHDTGALYVPEAVAAAIRDHLLPLADATTPNRFELRWLAGRDVPFAANAEAADAAAALGPAQVLVTSAFPLMRDHTGNMLVEEASRRLAEHRALPRAPNGTGDLTSALLAHHLVAGTPAASMLERLTASVFEVVARTVKAGGDELALEGNLASLSRPMAPVSMRLLGGANAVQAKARAERSAPGRESRSG